MADRTWYSKEKADEVFATKREVDALRSNLEGRVPDTSTLATKDEVSRGDDALSSRIDAVKVTADGALQSSSAAVTYSTKEEALATERKLGERIDSAVSTAATKNELAKYATTTSVAETYATKESLGSYLKTEDAASTYATKAALAQAQLSGGGGAAPDLSGFATKSEMRQADDNLGAKIEGVKSAADAALPKAEAESTYATKSALETVRGSIPSVPDMSAYLTTTSAAATYATKGELAAHGGGGGASSPLASLPLRPGQPVPTVGYFGDSWSTEAMMGAGFNQPAAISRLIGGIPVVSSVDGSGFAHSKEGTLAFEVDSRVNAVCAAAPNLIVTIGSLNSDKVIENGNPDGSKITEAVKSFITKVRSKLPQVPIIMIGAEPSSVSRLLSNPSHINVKAHKAGVEASGGLSNGVAFVDWLGVADKQAVPWRDSRQCAAGDVVVYNGVAYRVTQAWTPESGQTPLSTGAPVIQVSDVLSGTGNEGNKKGDGTRDTLLMADDTHPTKIGSVAFGAAAAKHIADALASLASWITAQGPVVPAPSALPQPHPPATQGDGLPVMAWLQSGWGTAGRTAYTLDEIKAVAALHPDRVALPVVRTDETISPTNPDAAVAIETRYVGTDGKRYNFSDGSLAGVKSRGVEAASMVASLDALEAAGITVMPNPRNGLEDYGAQWSLNSTEKIAKYLLTRTGKTYEAILGRAENALRTKLVAGAPGLKLVSDNTDGPADWQVTDVKNSTTGILGPTAGAPGWGAAAKVFTDGVWVLVSNKDEQETARSLAKVAGAKIVGWAAPTAEALAAIRS